MSKKSCLELYQGLVYRNNRSVLNCFKNVKNLLIANCECAAYPQFCQICTNRTSNENFLIAVNPSILYPVIAIACVFIAAIFLGYQLWIVFLAFRAHQNFQSNSIEDISTIMISGDEPSCSYADVAL